MWRFILFFFVLEAKDGWFSRIYRRGPLGFRWWDRNPRIPKSTFFCFGVLMNMNTNSTNHATKKNMVFIRKPAPANFFPIWKGGLLPFPPKIPREDMLYCLCWLVFFFPKKISGKPTWVETNQLAKFVVGTLVGWGRPGGHEAGIYALAVSDRLVASGSKVGGWGGFGGEWRWGNRGFLHFFRGFFGGIGGGGDENKTTKWIFWWKDECSTFFWLRISYEDDLAERTKEKDR